MSGLHVPALVPAGAGARRRSLLYMGAFCVLGLALEAMAVAAPPEATRQPSFWLLYVLSMATGSMALWLRLSPEGRKASPRTSPSRPDEKRRMPPAVPARAASIPMDDLAAWRMARARLMERPLSPRLKPAPPPPPPPAEEPEPAPLEDLSDWLSSRARGFSRYDLSLPAEPIARAPETPQGKPAKEAKERKPFDPWAKVLEELDRREGGR